MTALRFRLVCRTSKIAAHANFNVPPHAGHILPSNQGDEMRMMKRSAFVDRARAVERCRDWCPGVSGQPVGQRADCPHHLASRGDIVDAIATTERSRR